MARAYDTSRNVDLRARLAAKISLVLSDAAPAASLDWARKGFAITTALPPGPATITCANQLGIWHKEQSHFDSAIYYFRIALAAGKATGAQRAVNGEQANLGQLYGLKGEFAEALKYQLPSLAYFEGAGIKEQDNLYITTLAVGNTYYHMKQPQKALGYYNHIYPQLKDQHVGIAAGLFLGMALCYGELGDHKREDDLLQKALLIKRAIGDSQGVAYALNNLGKAATAQGRNAVAAGFFRDALRIATALGNKELADEYRQNIAYTEAKRGNVQAAIAQYKSSLEMAKATGNLRIRKLVLQSLIDVYDSLHDYASAYKYISEYEGVADTTRSRNYVGAIADAETKYETQRALRERDRLGYESRLQTAARSRAVHERNMAIGIASCSLAAILLIVGLAWRIRSIRAGVREEQATTRAIFEGEQAERIRIARDLHDSIGQMLAVVKMRLSALPDLPQEGLVKSAGVAEALVDKTLAEVRSISHNLIPEDLALGIVRGIENLCARVSQSGNIAVRLSISDAVRARKFNQQFGISLYRIVQEVLGNMMKHSGATEIRVDMTGSPGGILLQIADNGKGFDTRSIGSSKGIGWKNIFARVNLLNGHVDVRSERISGTRIEIIVPEG